jgi:xanthine/CO dehydrogenase XdhC/CoxF family maturation factor
MSHHYARDLEYVRALVASDAAYIGVLGPSARGDRMRAGMTPEELKRSEGRMFSPVGLDLGGDGPEAIALSIISEASAVISARDGGHLRDRKASLH